MAQGATVACAASRPVHQASSLWARTLSWLARPNNLVRTSYLNLFLAFCRVTRCRAHTPPRSRRVAPGCRRCLPTTPPDDHGTPLRLQPAAPAARGTRPARGAPHAAPATPAPWPSDRRTACPLVLPPRASHTPLLAATQRLAGRESTSKKSHSTAGALASSSLSSSIHRGGGFEAIAEGRESRASLSPSGELPPAISPRITAETELGVLEESSEAPNG